jgi:hypothetical protein
MPTNVMPEVDALTMAFARALVAAHRANGLDDDEIRDLLLAELADALPEEALAPWAWDRIIAGFSWAVVEATS